MNLYRHPWAGHGPATLVARLAAVLALAVAAGCGGSGGGTVGGTDGGPGGGSGGGTSVGAEATPVVGAQAPASAEAALQTVQPGALVAYYKSRIQQRAARGLNGTNANMYWGDMVTVAAVAATDAGAAPGFAGTQVQEQGVDEDDLLKTDGRMMYALYTPQGTGGAVSPRLTASRLLADGSLSSVATLTLNPQVVATGMYLASGAAQLAVLGQDRGYRDVIAATQLAGTPVFVPPRPQVSLDLYRVADGVAPAPVRRVEIDGRLVGSRMIGNVLYVVSTWTPELSRYSVPPGTSPTQVETRLAGLSAAELLPGVRVDGAAAQPLVAESDCLLQPANASLGLDLTFISAFDLSTAQMQRSSRCFAGGSDGLYMSADNVYLTSSRQYWLGFDTAALILPGNARTDIHKFALRGMQIDYRGSGDVPGHLGWDSDKLRYRMSEYQGDLRVLSFTGQTGWIGLPALTPVAQKPASPATLTVLREDSGQRSLVAVATLPNAQRPEPLGHAGEQVYAVHFAGPRAYVVTFRQTDPLYVLDLSSPADPRAVGELTVPGFSDYLFPLADGKLLGVGKAASPEGLLQGLKVALFDVRNPAQPALLSSRTLGERGSSSALDYTSHGINILAQGSLARIALPVRVYEKVGPVTRLAYQGLARYQVDTSAGTLTERPLLLATRFEGTSADFDRATRYNLGSERSVQTTAGTYYLAGGELTYTAGP